MAMLASCQQRGANADQRLAEIEGRLASLERDLGNLAEEQRRIAERPQPATPAPVTAAPDRFELFGLPGPQRRYPTLERCEAAKQVILEAAAERAERVRTQGGYVLNEPTVSCIPV